MRRCPSGVSGGILPSVGSVTNQGRDGFADLENVPELQRPRDRAGRIAGEKPVALDGLLLAPLDHVGELLPLNVLDTLALELRRTLERRALLVLVGVVALQIRIAPRRLRDDVRLLRRLAGCRLSRTKNSVRR